MIDNILKYYNAHSLYVNIVIAILLVIMLFIYCIYRKQIKSFYVKNKEIINYVIVGGLTTVVSIGSYWLFRFLIKNYVILSIISWIMAVSFAYITNILFVFESKSKNIIEEISKFVSCRLLTLGLEVVLMIVFVSLLKINDMVSKIILQVVVLILNYIFSKLFVFKPNNKTTQ